MTAHHAAAEVHHVEQSVLHDVEIGQPQPRGWAQHASRDGRVDLATISEKLCCTESVGCHTLVRASLRDTTIRQILEAAVTHAAVLAEALQPKPSRAQL